MAHSGIGTTIKQQNVNWWWYFEPPPLLFYCVEQETPTQSCSKNLRLEQKERGLSPPSHSQKTSQSWALNSCVLNHDLVKQEQKQVYTVWLSNDGKACSSSKGRKKTQLLLLQLWALHPKIIQNFNSVLLKLLNATLSFTEVLSGVCEWEG